MKMTFEEFIKFVDKTISELVLYAEMHAGKDLSDHELEFQWQGFDTTVTRGRENIVYAITDKTYVDEDKIYPCVDLTIEKPNSREPVLKISGGRAGYEPRPFGRGWSHRPGPFIYLIGRGIKSKGIDVQSKEFKRKLKELGLIHYDIDK